jgi:NAD(P)-dependent dehydrogenase (short-subunit alcohol dehydrogenase family)
MNELDGKVVLVTGASRGLGYQAALEAARRGAHVIAIARTVGGLEDLDDDIKKLGGSTTLVPLDLRDYEAIDRLGLSIFQRWGKLDALVANAGLLGTITPLAHLDPKDFEQAFGLNVTANYRLIRSLDALLRQSDAGRAVFLSSGVIRGVRPFWGLYSASKAALEVMVRSYADELSVSKARANVFDPGRMRTQMRAKAYPGEDPDTLPHPSVAAPALIDMIMPSYDLNGQRVDMMSGETRPI